MNERGLDLLLTPAGREFLDALPAYNDSHALALNSALRKEGMDPDLVAAALTQSRLRARAIAKFGEFAERMLFTVDGLEQATRLEIAALHAQRYARADIQTVGDLGCGIGADSLAFSALGLSVVAVEKDVLTAKIAAENLRPFPEARVIVGDAMECDFEAEGIEAVFMDPARRTRSGTRVFDPAAYSPHLDAVLDLRHRTTLGVKVGPGIPYSALPSETHAQWVSVDGSVVEAGLWFGPLADFSGRSALVRTRDSHGKVSTHEMSWVGDADAPAATAPAGPLHEYLYEPDRAVIRSGLVALLVEELRGNLLDSSIAYITTPTPIETPFATGYRVLDSFDFGVKRLRAYLRDRDVGRVTIKKRGTAVTPEQLRPQLALKGSQEATVILTRVAEQQRVLIVEPLPN